MQPGIWSPWLAGWAWRSRPFCVMVTPTSRLKPGRTRPFSKGDLILFPFQTIWLSSHSHRIGFWKEKESTVLQLLMVALRRDPAWRRLGNVCVRVQLWVGAVASVHGGVHVCVFVCICVRAVGEEREDIHPINVHPGSWYQLHPLGGDACPCSCMSVPEPGASREAGSSVDSHPPILSSQTCAPALFWVRSLCPTD